LRIGRLWLRKLIRWLRRQKLRIQRLKRIWKLNSI